MLRYINGKLLEGNLSGNGFIDVTKDLLFETCKYLEGVQEFHHTSLDYSMKYQLLQCIGTLLNYITNIASIQIECYNSNSGTKDGAYVKSDKKALGKSKSIDYNRTKQPLPDGGGSSEQVTKQTEPQSKAGRSKFQILSSFKSSKKLKSSASKMKVNKIHEYSNSVMFKHEDTSHSTGHVFRRYHSSDNLLDSSLQASERAAFKLKDLSETCDIHTYDLPSMTRRSKLSFSDSNNDTDGYLKLDNSIMEVMPLNDTEEQVEKIKLEVNKTELGERVCVLRDYSLLIGKRLDGSIAEYACPLDQYSIDHEMSDEINFRLCISYNDINMLLSFKSGEIYEKWKQDIKKNMVKVRYISIHFPNQLIDPGYESINLPIYERISLYRKDSVGICEEKEPIKPDK